MQLGPLSLLPRRAVSPGAVKVAVRPEAWRVVPEGQGLPAVLRKSAYLGSVLEYTFDTDLGPVFVVSPDLEAALPVGARVALNLGTHGVSVVETGR